MLDAVFGAMKVNDQEYHFRRGIPTATALKQRTVTQNVIIPLTFSVDCRSVLAWL